MANYNVNTDYLQEVETGVVPRLYTEGFTNEAEELLQIIALAKTRSLTEYEYNRFISLQTETTKVMTKQTIVGGLFIIGLITFFYYQSKK